MNDYYNKTLTAIPGTLIRSSEANAEFTSVQSGFDLAQSRSRASLRSVDGEVLLALPAKATLANKSLAFDANGDPIVTVAASSAEMSAAVAAAVTSTTKAAEATAAAATVAGATNILQMLQLQTGVL